MNDRKKDEYKEAITGTVIFVTIMFIAYLIGESRPPRAEMQGWGIEENNYPVEAY